MQVEKKAVVLSEVHIVFQFRYADFRDVVLMTVGSFGAIVHGALYILSNVVLGLQMDAFLEYDKGNRYLWMFTDVWERYGVTIHDLWENKSMIEYVVVLGVLFVNDLLIPGFSLSSSFPFVRGEVLPATFSPPHLIVFSTLLCILSSSSSLPPRLSSSHLS